MKIKVYERMWDTRLIEIFMLIIIISTLLCVSIWMFHMFVKLICSELVLPCSLKLEIILETSRLISNWSVIPVASTSLFRFLLFHLP